MAMAVKLEKRLNPSAAMNVIVPLVSVLAAFVVGAIFLTLTDRDPLEVYTAMFKGALGSQYGLAETVVKAIPLMLCALGISAAFRMQLWNIGAEGQFYMGGAGHRRDHRVHGGSRTSAGQVIGPRRPDHQVQTTRNLTTLGRSADCTSTMTVSTAFTGARNTYTPLAEAPALTVPVSARAGSESLPIAGVPSP